jgi:hypothetical protein
MLFKVTYYLQVLILVTNFDIEKHYLQCPRLIRVHTSHEIDQDKVLQSHAGCKSLYVIFQVSCP